MEESWTDIFTEKNDSYYGFVRSLEQANELINEFEYVTCTSYSETRSSKNFGQFNLNGK